MKRLVFFSIIGILSLTSVSAQEGLKIGPGIGLISSKPFVSDTILSKFNFRYKLGANFGISMFYGFNQQVGIMSGAHYIVKGYRIFNDSNNGGTEIRNNFKSIEVPINLCARFRYNSVAKVRGVLGLSFNYLLNSEGEVLYNDNKTFVIREVNHHKINGLVNVGFQFMGESKSGNMTSFGILYKHPLLRQSDLEVRNQPDLSKSRLFALGFRGAYINLSLSYMFDLRNFKRKEEIYY